jgi:hypothetical protein
VPVCFAAPELLSTLPHLKEVGILRGQPAADEYAAELHSKMPLLEISTQTPH